MSEHNASPKKGQPSRKENIYASDGGGAARGTYHVGEYDAEDQLGIVVRKRLGTSIGAYTATLRTNKIANDVIADSLSEDLFANANPWLWLRTLLLPLNPLQWLGLLNLLPVMRSVVKKYALKPNDELEISTYDLIRREHVVWRGTDYDLAVIMAAACSVPGMMRPQPYWHKGRFYLLVDGGVYHPHPGHFADGKTIVNKLIDFPLLGSLFGDRDEDVVISLSDWFAPFFTVLSRGKVNEQRKLGYERSLKALSEAIVSGELFAEEGPSQA